jgi:Cd2+/Zn2+-exporting ATPase
MIHARLFVTDRALETTDVALMADDLSKLPYTIKLRRKALNIIKQYITFSLGIKVVALLLVIPGRLILSFHARRLPLQS